jgi:butyryl-CoA dehydrogenase
MSYLLTEEQQLIRNNARDFAKEHLEPFAFELDKTGMFPAQTIERMAQHDLLSWFLPEVFGGAEVGYLSYVIGVEELSKASAAVAAILVSHASAAYAINRWGSQEQKQQCLPMLAKGENLAALAITESGPAVGEGPRAVIANKQGAGFVLNGEKTYVANAGEAGLYVVIACTDPALGSKGLAHFLVHATGGLQVGPKKRMMGLRGRPTADVSFNNVPAELLGSLEAGPSLCAELLSILAIAEAAQTVGITSAALEHAAKYSQQRVQFGRPIGAFEAIQTMLAEMATNCHVARCALYHAATLVEHGVSFAREAAMVKMFSQRLGMNSLIDAVQIEGGYGYSEEMIMAKLFRDVSGTTIAESPLEFPEQLIAACIG